MTDDTLDPTRLRLSNRIRFGEHLFADVPRLTSDGAPYDEDEMHIGFASPGANAVLSLCTSGKHRTLLDVDNWPADEASLLIALDSLALMMTPPLEYRSLRWLVTPSSSPGCWHAWSDHQLPWSKCVELLNLAVDLGVCDPVYRDVSVRRGFCTLRMPGVTKPVPVTLPLVGPSALAEVLERMSGSSLAEVPV